MHKFRLEILLRHRKHIEECCQKALADSQAFYEKEKQTLEGFEETRHRCENRLNQKLKDAPTASDVIIFQRYIRRLALDIDEQRVRVHEARSFLEQRRLNLLEAMKKKKILKKLKENQLRQHHLEMTRKEQAFINEVASNRHHRSG